MYHFNQIIFSEDSFGITQKSLEILRDALANSLRQNIAVVQVDTNDLCCGFFIFNPALGIVTWTGDGFRTDRGGEGGAGYKSAEALVGLFGLRITISDVRLDEQISRILSTGNHEEIEAALRALAKEVAGGLINEDFRCAGNPQYVR